MNIWNKVLLGMIIAASAGLIYMASWTLKTHAFWMAKAQEIERILDGDGKTPGLRQQNLALKAEIAKYHVELDKLIASRPRIWSNCAVRLLPPDQKNPVTVEVTIEAPAPNGIEVSKKLFAFEQPAAEKSGAFLGEYLVTKKEGDKKITIVPAFPLHPHDRTVLTAAKGPWVLYDALPQDNHELFAQWTDEQKKALLPAGSLEEYRRDGQAADAKDPAEQVVDGKYVRPLRDYEVLLNHARLQDAILYDQIESTTRDKALVEESLADAKVQKTFYEAKVKEYDLLSKKSQGELGAVQKHFTLLKEKLDSIDKAIKYMLQENQAMAGQIATNQLEAMRRIDARTRAMAQNAGRD